MMVPPAEAGSRFSNSGFPALTRGALLMPPLRGFARACSNPKLCPSAVTQVPARQPILTPAGWLKSAYAPAVAAAALGCSVNDGFAGSGDLACACG